MAEQSARHPDPKEQPGADWRYRIVSTPGVVGGKPRIDGTRIWVGLILGWLASGETVDWVLEQYPDLTRDDVLACLAYARDLTTEHAA